MGQMFDKTRDQMNDWRLDNASAFVDEVDRSNLQTTCSGKFKRNCEVFSWYGSSDNISAKIEPPSCRQYKSGHLLGVRTLNWNQIIDKDHDDDIWADPGAPSAGRCGAGDGNDNDRCQSEEDMQGDEKGTGNGNRKKDWKSTGKASEAGKGKGKEMGKGNTKGKCIVMHTPGGDDISRAVALQLQRELSDAYMDTEG
jgi:hypothetical protein